MGEHPAVSVIVPVYNMETLVKRCVASVQAQTMADFELLLLDDGSTDGTAQVCEALAAEGGRVRFAALPHGGVAAARNAGLGLATGDYVFFLDGDDELLPDALETLHALAGTEHAQIALGGLARVTAAGGRQQPMDGLRAGVWCGAEEISQNLLLPLLGRASGGAQSLFLLASACRGLYGRDFLNAGNIRFPALAFSEDLAFNVEAFARAGTIAATNAPVYLYHDNPVSRTNAYDAGRFALVRAAYAELRRRVAHWVVPVQQPQALMRLAGWFLGQVSVCARKEAACAPQNGNRVARGRLAAMLHSPDVRAALRTARVRRPRQLMLFCAAARCLPAWAVYGLLRIFSVVSKDGNA